MTETTSPRALRLDPEDAARIITAAQARFPAECCGLLEGTVQRDVCTVLAVHETGNLADNPDRHFLIDPARQIALLRDLRGTGRDVIGCFHSHPGGRPEPSATDRASAMDENFVWLVAGGGPRDFALRAWLFTGCYFRPLELQVAAIASESPERYKRS